MAVKYNFGKHNSLLCWYNPEINGKTDTNVVVVEYPGSEVKEFGVDMCIQPKLNPEKMYNLYPTDNKPQVLTNCSFFATSTGESIWNLKSNGVNYSKDDNFKYGIGIPAGLPSKVVYGEFNNGTGWSDFMTPYPDLILLGTKTDVSKYKDINYKAKRQVFGCTKNQDKYFHISVVGGNGYTLEELQNLILKLFPDTYYAGNFDGGGSTYTNVEGKRLSAVGYLRPIDTVWVTYLRSDAERQKAIEEEKQKENQSKPEEANKPKPKPKKVGYRCQLGYFSKIDNAKAYCMEVQRLEGVIDYSKAFVTKDATKGGYRVQVGFFSKKSGAEKVKVDLESKGYNCYVRYVEE